MQLRERGGSGFGESSQGGYVGEVAAGSAVREGKVAVLCLERVPGGVSKQGVG